MELQDTWSYAPTPSTDSTVASGSASVANLTACPTQSTPARVDSANWNGAHVSLTAVLNCLASVFATNRLKDDPVAMPQTPPSFFRSAVIVANMKDWVAGGVLAVAKLPLQKSTKREFPRRPNRLSTFHKIKALAAQPRTPGPWRITIFFDSKVQKTNIIVGWECGPAEICTELLAGVLGQAGVAVSHIKDVIIQKFLHHALSVAHHVATLSRLSWLSP